MKLELKSAALEFARANCAQPACVIQQAMEIGAALAVGQIAKDLARMNVEMENHRHDIERGTPHGHSNGHL